MDAAAALIRAVFRPKSPIAPEELPAQPRTDPRPRTQFLAARCHPQARRRLPRNCEPQDAAPAYEVRWLNLGGFCLRPGFGYIGDDYRIEQVRRIYSAGLQFGNQVQNEIDWWIFWGRLAGGLNRNQQVDMVQRLLPLLIPKPGKKPPRLNNSLQREMWRTAS